MKHTLKRTLSFLLALTMVLSLGLPAYAVGDITVEDQVVEQNPAEDDIILADPVEDPAEEPADGLMPVNDKVVDVPVGGKIGSVDDPIGVVKGEVTEKGLIYPENDFTYEEAETGFAVEVHAPDGALPMGTEMRVTRLNDLTEVQAAVDAAENLEGAVQLAADISFWHEGEEIEPTEGTKLLVRMSAPEIEGIADPIVIHVPDGENAVPEIVDQMKKTEDDIVLTNTVEFEASSFSTYAIVGQNRSITVYYGFMEGNTFIRFDSRNISSTSSSYPNNGLNQSNYHNIPYTYLVYDFPGYTYKETHLQTATGTRIWPVLRCYEAYVYDGWNSGYYYNWQYSNYSNTSANWNTFTNTNNKVFVIYEKKTVSQGYSSEGSDDPTGDPPEVPDLPVGKKVKDNGDGTFDITLSVTGVEATQEKVTKASVIVIFDASGSMRWEMSSNTTPDDESQSRMNIAKAAVKNLASNLLNKTDSNGNKLVQMALVEFATTTSVYNFSSETGVTPKYTSNASTFNAAVDGITQRSIYGGITNWEQALDYANALDVPDDAPTYVIFVSDGDPTVHISRRNLSDSQVYSLQRLEYDYTVYGESSGLGSTIRDGMFGYSGGRFDTDLWPLTQEHYDAAVPAAQAIIAAHKDFYTIGLSSSVTRMEDFTNDAYGGTAPEEHYFPATSQQQLKDAFDKIAKAVESNLGFTNVAVNDGVTEMTTVESSALTGEPMNFVYRKGPHGADEYDQNPEWTGSDVPQATITADNHVIWDIASIGKLEKGTTYSVSFTVWPGQEAYNIIADINNGIIRDEDGNIVRIGTPDEAYAAQPESVRGQIGIVGGVYTLLTNTGLSVSYTFNTVNGTQDKSSSMETKRMPLSTTYFGMTKDWSNVLPQDTRTANVLTKKDADGKSYLVDSNGNWVLDDENNKIEADWSNFNSWKDKAVYYVDLIVTKGGKDYTEVRLTSDKSWKWDQMFVAPGVLTHDKDATSGTLDIREIGDDYTVREKEEESYYWELHAETYHPMVINGEACMLQLVKENAPELAENTFSGDYYNINGEIFKKLGSASDAKIEAVNERRSYLNLTKAVDGAEGKDGYSADDLFTYTLKLENPNGKYKGVDTDYNSQYDDFWFSAYDPVAKATVTEGFEVTGGDVAAEMKDGKPTGYWHFSNVENGQEITIKIKAGWNVRFINLVSGTKYEFVETAMNDGYSFKEIEATAEKNNSAVDYEPTITEADKKIVGTIEQPNTDYTVTYTNEFKGCFYVYHAGDNTIEKIFLTDARVVDGKFNIANETKDHYLYGGYYTDYAGKGTFELTGDKALTFEKTATAVATTYNGNHENGNWATITNAGQTPYRGDASLWTGEGIQAIEESGLAMTPVANTVYYLKEVPDVFMRGALRYTYYENEAKDVGTVWLVCAIDGKIDAGYNDYGLMTYDDGNFTVVASAKTDASIANIAEGTLTIKARTTGLVLDVKVDGDKGLIKGMKDNYFINYSEFTGNVGYIMIRDKDKHGNSESGMTNNLIADDQKTAMYWVTPDNVRVTGVRLSSISNIDGTKGPTGTENPIKLNKFGKYETQGKDYTSTLARVTVG